MVKVNFEIVFIIGISIFRCLFYKRFIFEEVVPLSNDPIMSKRLIQSFRHLEHQNLSIISDSIDSARCGQIFSLQVMMTKIGLFQNKNFDTVV